MTEPRILFVDIETAPLLSWTWSRWNVDYVAKVEHDFFLLTLAWKWKGERKASVMGLDDFPGYTKDPTNDSKLVAMGHKLFDEATVIIAHNGCVEAPTPVLTTDLRWIAAGDLECGDSLVGFDEYTPPGQFARRHIKPSIVTANSIESRECLRVIFDNGDEVITTPDHPWLKLAANSHESRWAESRNLVPGQRVRKFWTPWQDDRSYEAGWLSGFISGEGTLKGSQTASVSSLDFCQRPGATWEQALDYFKLLGIPLGNDRGPKTGGLGRGDTLYAYTTGGWTSVFSILGRLRIERLIANIDWDNMPSMTASRSDLSGVQTCKIEAVEPAGVREIAALGTSTRTYFAAGYPMHNTQFDTKRLQARMAVHGLKPPSPFREVDTLKIAKSKFGFSSNKLGDLCEVMGLGSKAETGGFDTWMGCYNGDPAAWKKMKRYNAHDVELLEQLYYRLQPWDSRHPNLSTLSGRPAACPKCGSEDGMIARGTMLSGQVSVRQRWQCKACGGYCSSRKTQKTDTQFVVV
jgi:hypothetical protein